MLTDDQIAFARNTANKRLTDTCTVIEPAGASRDLEGGVVDGTPGETPDVPCLLGPLGSRYSEERVIADKLSLVEPAAVYFRHDQAVSEQAQVRFPNGDVYEVRGFVPRAADQRIMIKAVCERVR